MRAIFDQIEPAPFGRGEVVRQERSEERTGGTVKDRGATGDRHHRTRRAGALSRRGGVGRLDRATSPLIATLLATPRNSSGGAV